jgi:hypothetical protein
MVVGMIPSVLPRTQASCPVDVPADARLHAEAGLASQLGPPIGCFEAAQRCVAPPPRPEPGIRDAWPPNPPPGPRRFCFEVMDEVYFAEFLASEPYHRLQSELADRVAAAFGSMATVPMATLEPSMSCMERTCF